MRAATVLDANDKQEAKEREKFNQEI